MPPPDISSAMVSTSPAKLVSSAVISDAAVVEPVALLEEEESVEEAPPTVLAALVADASPASRADVSAAEEVGYMSL